LDGAKVGGERLTARLLDIAERALDGIERLRRRYREDAENR
jgi:hypothetical protein